MKVYPVKKLVTERQAYHFTPGRRKKKKDALDDFRRIHIDGIVIVTVLVGT